MFLATSVINELTKLKALILNGFPKVPLEGSLAVVPHLVFGQALGYVAHQPRNLVLAAGRLFAGRCC